MQKDDQKIYCTVCENEKIVSFCACCKKETPDLYKIVICDTANIKESIGIKQRRVNVSGWIRKTFQGFKKSGDQKKFPEGVNIQRNIDRENNQYDEVVRCEKTGRIINECHEPLSEHKGHGSMQKK